jgi:xylan 1,4-beta-xylosidase
MKYPALVSLLGGLSLSLNGLCSPAQPVHFHNFTYTGKDAIFSAPLAPDEFQNPILAGFYPDPSVVRAGDDYYLANSSFSWSPGVPIFHSKDLVHWESLGYALVTPKQLPLYNQQVSRGIYAPTLRHHKGVFYLITTQVDTRGNFLVTATNPAGPWSDPIALPEVGGIDPDIFFDDDGRVYITHNDEPEGQPLYQGHRAIWQWEFDLASKKIVKYSRRLLINGGTDISKKPVWVEGPHIYKINGWYYLLAAEGGTEANHSAVVFRSRSLQEPFVPYEGNPILTQRYLDPARTNPIANTGHADLVQTKEGEWWAVFLGTRPYDQNNFNTGRETFLHPVRWNNEWPVIIEPGKPVPLRMKRPKINASIIASDATTGNFTWIDNFSSAKLANQWNILGTLDNTWYSIAKNGGIDIFATDHSLTSLAQPAFIARRQQHTRFEAQTHLQLPQQTKIAAGIAAFQNESFHYFLGVKKAEQGYVLFVEQVQKGASKILSQQPLVNPTKDLTLRITGDGGKISFHWLDAANQPLALLKDADATLLSSNIAGGFVGTYVGMHVRREP